MKSFFKNENGSITFPVGIMIFLILIFMLIFFIIVSKSTMNLVLHEIKSELYLINRNAIFAIQKDLMGEDITCLYESELEALIENGIKISWGLDNKLRNGKSLIESAELQEVLVLESGDVDTVTKDMMEDLMVHTVIKVKVKPVIFGSIIGDKCEFDFHQDIRIKKMTL